jgi:hypothetical protein
VPGGTPQRSVSESNANLEDDASGLCNESSVGLSAYSFCLVEHPNIYRRLHVLNYDANALSLLVFVCN